jgi:hypothetical protein
VTVAADLSVTGSGLTQAVFNARAATPIAAINATIASAAFLALTAAQQASMKAAFRTSLQTLATQIQAEEQSRWNYLSANMTVTISVGGLQNLPVSVVAGTPTAAPSSPFTLINAIS